MGLGAKVVARIAAGDSVRAISLDPGMPSPTTIHKWSRDVPAFAEAVATARRTARRSDVLRRTGTEARRKLALQRPWRRPDAFSAELGEEICARIAGGESLVAICAAPGMPVTGTVYGWLHAHEDFAEHYVMAREAQAELLADEAWRIAQSARPETVPLARLQFDVIRWRAARLSPKKWGELGETGRPRVNIYVQRFSDGEILSGPDGG